jgi:hypothetical protein
LARPARSAGAKQCFANWMLQEGWHCAASPFGGRGAALCETPASPPEGASVPFGRPDGH